MASGYEKAECGIKSFTPTRFTRRVDLAMLAAGYLLMALKTYLLWRAFQ